MSKYVQRCTECRQVRGVSSFGVKRPGGRVSVCRWCVERSVERARLVRSTVRSLVSYRREEAELVARLTAVRREIRTMEYEAFALSQERGTRAEAAHG